MTEALQNMIHTIDKMVSMDSVTTCRRARLLIEDSMKQNQIIRYQAIGMCAMRGFQGQVIFGLLEGFQG